MFNNQAKQYKAIKEKTFVFEELAFFNLADREPQKMTKNHITKLKYMYHEMVDNPPNPSSAHV